MAGDQDSLFLQLLWWREEYTHCFWYSTGSIWEKNEGVCPIAFGLQSLQDNSQNCRPRWWLKTRLNSSAPWRQLGFGGQGGAEAAVTREYPSDQNVLKLDFRNAFNSIHCLEALWRMLYTWSGCDQSCWGPGAIYSWPSQSVKPSTMTTVRSGTLKI